MADVLIDALLDSLKVLPFLILVYVLIEVIEHTASSKITSKLLRGPLSPLIAAGVGVIPQCGFSVVATKLYTNRSIALGTLLAVYISTSDEAVAILLSDFSAINLLLPLLLIKVVYAVIVGYAVNFFVRKRQLAETDEHLSCRHAAGYDEKCNHCEQTSINHGESANDKQTSMGQRNFVKQFMLHPLMHALTTFIYIFAVNFAMGSIIYSVGEQAIASFMGKIGFLQPLLAAIVGLIPNCAASVVITQMYALGTLSLGGAVSGLSVSAGVGIAVLIKENKSLKDTLLVIGLLCSLSVLAGMAVTAIMLII